MQPYDHFVPIAIPIRCFQFPFLLCEQRHVDVFRFDTNHTSTFIPSLNHLRQGSAKDIDSPDALYLIATSGTAYLELTLLIVL
jgi:hypothetical protein